MSTKPKTICSFCKNGSKNQMKFDLVLYGGDAVNCDHEEKSHNEEEKEKLAIETLKFLQELFDCQMYFVPGSHDPLSFYKLNGQNSKFISPKIINAHCRNIEIAQNLELVGFQGSVPGFLNKERSRKKWPGFPYESNQMLEENLKKSNGLQASSPQKQKLVLTHVDPFSSMSTLDDRDTDELIYGGATAYDRFMKDDQVALYLHGHVHHGSKFVRYNERPFINPGAILNGEFGWVELKKEKQSKKWVYSNSHFISLIV